MSEYITRQCRPLNSCRTHRERRAKYLKGLEAEADVLRAKEARHLADLKRISAVNDKLRSLLRENQIPIPPELEDAGHVDMDDSHEVANTIEFLQPSDTSTSHTSSTSPEPTASPQLFFNLNDPQTAIDFILDMEATCLVAHHHHRGPDGEQGHFMQLQHMVLKSPQSARIETPYHRYPALPAWNSSSVHLEDSLQRLLDASRCLGMKGELTPVQCWDMLRVWPPATKMAKKKFDELKRALLPAVVCYG